MNKFKKLNQIFIICLVLLFLGISSVHANEEHGEHKGNYKPVIKEASQGDLNLKIVINPGTATVGHLTEIKGELTKGGTKVPNVRIAIDTWHIEDQKSMFKTDFISEDGNFTWANQFFDGADHRLTVTVYPTAQSIKFKPIKTQLVVPVIAIHPPKKVAIKTLGMLLGIAALGIWGGYKLVGLTNRRKLITSNV